jgi:predicted signal transduction protein with EAL and GGDEF domain
MTKADLALYKAKGNGKAQAQVFHDEMDTDYRYRQRLKAELRQAVPKAALTLVYQPIVDLKTRRVVSCEALARWHHPSWARSRRRCSFRSPRRPAHLRHHAAGC